MADTINRPDWKTELVGYGLGLIFIIKFGKFVALEIWEAIGPFFR